MKHARMDTKLYYTEAEIMAIPHTSFLKTDTNLYLNQDGGKFLYYKKLFLLIPNASEVSEIYVEWKIYLTVKEYLENSMSRYMKEFEGYVFYSIKDYMDQLNEANKNRMF